MARSTKVSMNWFAPDDSTWCASFNYIPAFPGSWEDPPESEEVEFLHFDEELEKDFQGPGRRLDLDELVELYQLKDKDIDAMNEKACEEAYDFLGGGDEENEDDGCVAGCDEDFDRFDIEYDR